MKNSSRRETVLAVLCIVLLGIVILCLNLPWSPVHKGLGPDSGLFAYIGSAIVKGQVPYLDMWDHKPPVAFYLNALAVLLFGQTPWAIWWFNLIWITFSVIAFLFVIRKMMGWLAAFSSSLVFLLAVMNPAIFQGGNLTEIYGLLFQVLVVGTAYHFLTTKQDRWVFLAGLLTGLAFMTKPTTVALGLSCGTVILGMSLVRREFKSLWQRSICFAAGLLMPIGVGALYWFIMGALNEFLAASIIYNLGYVGTGAPFLWSIKHTVLSVFPGMFISKIYWIAAIAFLPYIFINFRKLVQFLVPDRKRVERALGEILSPVETTMLAIFVTLPIELVFASLGGRNFGHYFLSLVPAVATVIAYIVWKLTTSLQNLSHKRGVISLSLVACWVLLTAGVFLWSGTALRGELPTRGQWESLSSVFNDRYPMGKLEKYVMESTGPEDPVLVWHIHLGINFTTNRRPPQRILFPANIFIPADRAKSNLDEFLVQLEADPPKLILVQEVSSIGMPFVNIPIEEMCLKGCIPGLAEAMQHADVLANLATFRDYFLENYTYDTKIYDWIVYRLVR